MRLYYVGIILEMIGNKKNWEIFQNNIMISMNNQWFDANIFLAELFRCITKHQNREKNQYAIVEQSFTYSNKMVIFLNRSMIYFNTAVLYSEKQSTRSLYIFLKWGSHL